MTSALTLWAMTQPTASGSTRERIIAAARGMTVRVGWSAVSMGRLADDAGLSRQTVYNEFGSKAGLAEAVVLTELALFLDVVETAFRAEPDDLVAGIRGAIFGVLDLAERDELLRAVVGASHGANSELLPLLTTEAETVLAMARDVVYRCLAAYKVPFDEAHLRMAAEVVVRTTLSQVMQPSGAPANVADDIAWVAARVLRP
jgi:AcrR family transcriptional regulator